jgi:hypothetical protein
MNHDPNHLREVVVAALAPEGDPADTVSVLRDGLEQISNDLTVLQTALKEQRLPLAPDVVWRAFSGVRARIAALRLLAEDRLESRIEVRT